MCSYSNSPLLDTLLTRRGIYLLSEYSFLYAVLLVTPLPPEAAYFFKFFIFLHHDAAFMQRTSDEFVFPCFIILSSLALASSCSCAFPVITSACVDPATKHNALPLKAVPSKEVRHPQNWRSNAWPCILYFYLYMHLYIPFGNWDVLIGVQSI